VIALNRLPEPDVLAMKGEKWLERFLNNPGRVPNSRQYGHQDIKNTLRAMSFHKCFYCERKLSEAEDEIDHYIEVAEVPEQAFVWENLYLCCRSCNGKKLPNSKIAAKGCLNPCDSSVDPSDHLTFTGEIIQPRADSTLGARTIQKYQLDRDELNYLRLQKLQQFTHFLLVLQAACKREGRQLKQGEKETIMSFGQANYEFSLMFRSYLAVAAPLVE